MLCSEEEIESHKEGAKQYFMDQFGLDVDSLAAQGRIDFGDFSLNPDYQYRVQIASGKGPNDEGWIIRDGGYIAVVIDPAGIELGGNSEGLHANMFNAYLYGDYNVLVTNSGSQPKEEMIIQFRSTEAAKINADGSMDFRCAVFNEEFGEGVAYGSTILKPMLDGKLRGNGRTVVSWPSLSPISFFPESPEFGYSASSFK